MPKLKTRLTRAEEARYGECLRQLETEGVNEDADLPDGTLPADALDIRVGPPPGNAVFERFRGGVPLYAVNLALVAKISNLVLVGWELTTPWDRQIQPVSGDESGAIWNFSGEQLPVILNGRIEDGLCLRLCGDVFEGWLLGSGSKPIPPEYRREGCIAGQLTLRDSLGREYSTDVALYVQPSNRPRQPTVGRGFGSCREEQGEIRRRGLWD